MPDPTGRISHLPDMHRGVAWKEPCRVATTASITISTALNAGDTIDGVTLAAGDRVLVKDQSTGSQNGIYIAGVTPVRAFDMDQDASTSVPASEVMGAIVYVIAGTTNAGTLWKNTNTSAPTIGSTSLTFSQIASTGLSDPMTTRGDIIIRNSSNVTARLGKGAAGTILTSDGTDVAWGNGPMTTQDDIIVGGASGVPTRLAKGSDSQVLTVDPTTHHLVWATPSGGSGTITTKDEGSTLSSTVTTLDFVGAGVTASGSGATTTVTISGGGGSSWPPLDQYSIDGTYGDLFNGGSLNARWTRRNYTGGAETFGFTKASTGLRILVSGRTNGDGYLQTAPAGDWTFAMKYAFHQFGANTSNWGIAVVDSAGSGLVAHLYNAPFAFLTVQLTTYTTYGGSYIQPGITTGSPNVNMTGDSKYFQERPIWLWLRKSSTSYYVNVSVDGEAWWVEGGPITWSGTVDRIGMLHSPIGTATGGTGATNDVYWFNKIA